MRYIKVKTQFEWFHRYKKAPKEVAFLRNEHRHDFGVIAKIEVLDLDRELEYFIVQRKVNNLIEQFKKQSKRTESCEMMAEFILDYLEIEYPNRHIEVEVNEDWTNGSIISNRNE